MNEIKIIEDGIIGTIRKVESYIQNENMKDFFMIIKEVKKKSYPKNQKYYEVKYLDGGDISVFPEDFIKKLPIAKGKNLYNLDDEIIEFEEKQIKPSSYKKNNHFKDLILI
jgi:hypothetical protein